MTRTWIKCGKCGVTASVPTNGAWHRYQLCVECYANTTLPDPDGLSTASHDLYDAEFKRHLDIYSSQRSHGVAFCALKAQAAAGKLPKVSFAAEP